MQTHTQIAGGFPQSFICDILFHGSTCLPRWKELEYRCVHFTLISNNHAFQMLLGLTSVLQSAAKIFLRLAAQKRDSVLLGTFPPIYMQLTDVPHTIAAVITILAQIKEEACCNCLVTYHPMSLIVTFPVIYCILPRSWLCNSLVHILLIYCKIYRSLQCSSLSLAMA